VYCAGHAARSIDLVRARPLEGTDGFSLSATFPPLPPIFDPRFLAGLPLHIGWGVIAITRERDHMINDVTGACTVAPARRRTRMLPLELRTRF
jgi:hypothetical protein